MKVCLGGRWGGTVPAIRTLWANIELQEHKDLQHEQMLSASRFYGSGQNPYYVLQSFVKEAVWQAYIDHISMANSVPIFIRKALFDQMKALSLSPFSFFLTHFILTMWNTAPSVSI